MFLSNYGLYRSGLALGELFQKIDLSDVIYFVCGYAHTLVLTKNGLFGCGLNGNMQLGVDDFNEKYVQTFKKINFD
jgi:alpha-tubulin suppressor-like RCC1 family protein